MSYKSRVNRFNNFQGQTYNPRLGILTANLRKHICFNQYSHRQTLRKIMTALCLGVVRRHMGEGAAYGGTSAPA